jgi:hypothetical protein
MRTDSHIATRRVCLTGFPTAVALAAAGLTVARPKPVLAQVVELIVDVAAVAHGHRASKLIGSSVSNDQKEKIGTLDDIIISHDRVLFAVLQVGGFLRLGGHMVAVPYQSLVLEDPEGKITLPGATKDELKKLPEFKYAS